MRSEPQKTTFNIKSFGDGCGAVGRGAAYGHGAGAGKEASARTAPLWWERFFFVSFCIIDRMDTEAVQDEEGSCVLRKHFDRPVPSEYAFLLRQDAGGETWACARRVLQVTCNSFEGKEIKEKEIEKEISLEELRQREAEYEAAEAELEAAKRQATSSLKLNV